MSRGPRGTTREMFGGSSPLGSRHPTTSWSLRATDHDARRARSRAHSAIVSSLGTPKRSHQLRVQTWLVVRQVQVAPPDDAVTVVGHAACQRFAVIPVQAAPDEHLGAGPDRRVAKAPHQWRGIQPPPVIFRWAVLRAVRPGPLSACDATPDDHLVAIPDGRGIGTTDYRGRRNWPPCPPLPI